jgi:hypothetical protein
MKIHILVSPSIRIFLFIKEFVILKNFRLYVHLK